MGDNSELERLNRLGKEAAGRALHNNPAMNNINSYIAQHAGRGSGRFHMPIAGRISLTVLVWIVLSGVFSVLGFPVAPALALGVVMLLEVGLFCWKIRRRHHLKNKAINLQAQLHTLKQQEFDLRYQEAKDNGDLNRFEVDK